MSAFDQLLSQIDAFIRKYYKSEILKGVLIILGFLFASWLTVSVLEYFGRFGSTVRLLLLLVFIGTNCYFLGKYFVVPFMRLIQFGKRINRYQAAKIIGRFFPNVSDRLLNTLQLNAQMNENDRSFELIRASVAQRSNDLLTVRFEDAIKYSESKKYLKYVIPVIFVFSLVLVIAPNWITKGSSNVVNFSRAQEAPFEFHFVDAKKKIREGVDYELVVDVTGMYVPEHVFVVSNRGRFKMEHVRKNRLKFTFNDVKSDLDFRLQSEGYYSKEQFVKVLGNSSLGSIVAELSYPKYLGKKNEVFSNVADLTVPEGTKVHWKVKAKNTKWVRVVEGARSERFTSQQIDFNSNYRNDTDLQFILMNSDLNYIDSNTVAIHVVKDAYPSILVNERIDSIKPSIRSFDGLLSDDIGLSKLQFNYTIKKKDGSELNRSMLVKSSKGVADIFSFTVDFSRDNISLEDKITYRFQVVDNDGVNGPKSTFSQAFVYELPTLTDLNKQRNETQNELKASLADLMKKTDQFNKDVEKLQKSLSNKSKSDFKNLEQVQQLKLQQQQLQEQMEEIKEKMEVSNEEKNKLTEEDKELLEQQKLLEELMKEVMDDELKLLLDELEKMMEKNQQQEIKKESDKLESTSDDMKKQLDRTLEMLKRLQVNEKIDALEDGLKELSEKQEALKEDLENKKLSAEEAAKKQEELNREFEELQKEMKELNELNNELQRPMQLSDFEKESESIKNEMQDAKSKLDSGKQSKAGQSQKSAADKMKEMADKMNSEQAASKSKQNQEDMALIRLLLENLMALSFDQEYVMKRFEQVRDTDPVYRKLGRKQRSIIDDNRVVEDSLIALAKRQPKVAPFIDKELKDIRSNFGLIVEEVDEHQRRPLLTHQQYVMTSYNNLALMLNESLQSMQQQQQQEGKNPGSGSCDNPGGSGSKPSEGGMSSDDMKEMLKKQLESMKKGPNPGGKQPGDKPGNEPGQGGNQGMPGLGNKEIAKMAAQQTAIRQRLEQLRNEMNKDGKGTGNKLNPLIQELEQQERDLINKKFSQEMIRRQQDILTRLLESEKAIRERGFEEKRESNSGKNVDYGNLIRFDEYKRERLGQIEMIRTVDPDLSKYYKDKANSYFNSVGN